MIRNLKLLGWKSHENTEIDLSHGTNVLVGIMGSGKSSILQGLTFGLFGEIPEVKSRKLTSADLIMRKPRRLEKAVVEVEFDVSGSIYRVKRTVTSKGSEAKLFKEKKIMEVGVRRVSEKVAELLGTDYETFVNVVYARQNDIDNFLRHGKSERVKMIDGLLRIDKLEDARKKLRSFHTGVKGKLIDLKERASKDIQVSKDVLSVVEKGIETANGELSDLQSVVSTSKGRLTIKRLKFQEMDKMRSKRDELNSRTNRLEGERDSLEDRVSKFPDIANAREKLSICTKKLMAEKAEETEYVSELAGARSKKEQIERRMNELSRYEHVLDTKVKDFAPEIEKSRQGVSYLIAQIQSHTQSVEQLKSTDARCPVCDAQIENPELHVKRHKRLAESLEKKLTSAKDLLNRLKTKQQESDSVRLEVEKAKELVKQIPRLKKELRGINLTEIETRLKAACEKSAQIEEEVSKLKGAVEREEATSRLTDVTSELTTLYRTLKSLGFDEHEYSSLRKEVDSLGNELSSNLARMQVIPKLIEAKQTEAAALHREIEEVDRAKQEFKRTRRKIESLAVLINALSDVQVVVRQNFLELVNEILGDIWTQLYPYGDYSSLRIYVESDGRRAGDYILQLRERKEWMNVDGVASGGERSIASLALRVAFAKALSRLGLLLLDEPTHNLDDNGIDKLTEVLREGMPSVLEQVVIITHEERMEKSATGAAYRLIRDKEIEEPTQIERL